MITRLLRSFQEMEEKCLAGLKERCTLHLAEIYNGETPFDAGLAETEKGDELDTSLLGNDNA